MFRVSENWPENRCEDAFPLACWRFFSQVFLLVPGQCCSLFSFKYARLYPLCIILCNEAVTTKGSLSILNLPKLRCPELLWPIFRTYIEWEDAQNSWKENKWKGSCLPRPVVPAQWPYLKWFIEDWPDGVKHSCSFSITRIWEQSNWIGGIRR